jgi:hypothetical protein
MMQKKLLSVVFLMLCSFVFGQLNSGFKGVVVDSKTLKPMQSVVVTIQNTTLMKVTDASGAFEFTNVPSGEFLVLIKSEGYTDQLLTVEFEPNEVTDLGQIVMIYDVSKEAELGLIALTENDLSDDNGGSESTSGLLQATRDVFLQAAAFNLGQARFRVRGFDNEYGTTMINGVVMNKMLDGRPQFSNWGGLNDATRNQEFTFGSRPSDYTFGGVLGTQEINTRASIYRPGTRLTFSANNTSYNFRTMATHASGMNKEGFGYVVSLSRRWADEAFFDGSSVNSNAIFISAEKKINEDHSINFTGIYSQNRRGRTSPNTEEVNNLMGIKYNSFWGYQEGERRNSRMRDVNEPMFMFSHYWKVNSKTNLNTNVSYQFGKIGNSRLDFNNVQNPDPVYYRNLPSYYTTLHGTDADGNTVWTPNYPAAEQARLAFLASPQVNWDAMYRANTVPITDANGIEIGRAPGESVYALYEDRIDDKQWNINTIMNSQISDNIVMNAGLNFRRLRSENFQMMLDLLGGGFFRDVDPFFAGDASQPDLNNPNRTIGINDKYGYNYILHGRTLDAFTQFKFTYSKVDFYLAQSYTRTEYQREGLYRNGIYPNNSFGKSRLVEFDNFGFKGGLTYKLTGRHLFDVNAIYMTKAPNLRNTFPNARLSNQITQFLDSETIFGGDVSYIIRAPKLKARFTGFFNKVKNATEVGFFFAEGIGLVGEDGQLAQGNGNAFVAEIVTGLDRKNMGIEVGLEYQITSTLKATGVAAIGQYTIDSNPNVQLNADFVRRTINYGTATMKNYKMAGMPQQAYSVGLEYRDPKFWFIGANVNYLADNYLDISAIMRTDNFFNNDQVPIDNLPIPNVDEQLARQYLKQEKFDDFFMLNLTGGKSWRISKKNRNTFGFFASINNLLDVKYRTGGFEQGRNANFVQVDQDHAGGVRAFGPRYFYGFGRNYFINFYINL